MSKLIFVLSSGGGDVKNSLDLHNREQISDEVRSDSLNRALQKAARAVELAKRQRERAEREARRALRDAERALRNAQRTQSGNGQISNLELLRALEILRALGIKPEDENENSVPEGTVSSSPEPKSAKQPHASSTEPPSSSIFGKVRTHSLGGRAVQYIEGITTLSPTKAAETQHYNLFKQLSEDNKSKFLVSQQCAKERILMLGQLVGTSVRFILPDDIFKFWLTPSDEETIARATYVEDGRAYPSIDLDDIVKNDKRTVSHYIGHELVHMLSLHQTYQSTGETESGLQYEITIFQVGLCFRQKTEWTVRNIERKHWDEWARTILSIDKEVKAGKSEVKLDKISRTALQMIHMFQEKFGSKWLSQAKATIKTKGESLYEIKTWTAEVDLVTGENLNEILTEYLARILSCENMLHPTAEEVQWFKDTKIYANLDGINQLMNIYCSIDNQVDKIDYLGSVIRTLQTANLADLCVEIAKYDNTAKASGALVGNLAPQHAKITSPGNDFLNLLGRLFK
jgi:hypothetical protein